MSVTFRLSGDWSRANVAFAGLTKKVHAAALDSIREEGVHLQKEISTSFTSGTVETMPFGPSSPLAVLLGGNGKVVGRNSAGVVVHAAVTATGVFVGVRGELALTLRWPSRKGLPRRRGRGSGWFQAALSAAGIVRTRGRWGEFRVPAWPLAEPVADWELDGSPERIAAGFAKRTADLF